MATATCTTGTTAGTTHNVKADDGTNTGTSGDITTATGSADHIVLSAAAGDLTSGDTRDVTATLVDTNGNTVDDSSTQITFEKPSGSGSVDGLSSFTADHGV